MLDRKCGDASIEEISIELLFMRSVLLTGHGHHDLFANMRSLRRIGIHLSP